MNKIEIPIKDIPCPGSVELPSETTSTPGLFIVRHPEGINAFLNRCPHNGSELNWQPNQFFDRDGEYLICSLHGALFQPTDGLCVAGPCRGQGLTEIPIQITDSHIQLQISAGAE